MLVMLKEMNGKEERDVTVNVQQVVSVSDGRCEDCCIVTMTDGKEIYVKGNVQEVSRRLRSNKTLLKG